MPWLRPDEAGRRIALVQGLHERLTVGKHGPLVQRALVGDRAAIDRGRLGSRLATRVALPVAERDANVRGSGSSPRR
ncbi:hypothetical protein AWV79_32220 [Cupriavidus sp. UYMMa02A]|nr:hypothetical protein AWV79_32220 [Cupriavidus sp. UYMMa02A]